MYEIIESLKADGWTILSGPEKVLDNAIGTNNLTITRQQYEFEVYRVYLREKCMTGQRILSAHFRYGDTIYRLELALDYYLISIGEK